MGTVFDRWEKDPFFSAAEEVQESADRMESAYRTWIHAVKDPGEVWNLVEPRRCLQTTVGTTKWQLEEFGRAVTSSYHHSNSVKDAEDRHQNFITAIENQIARAESFLNEPMVENGRPPSHWTRLDEGERDELAMFLSGPSSTSTGKTSGKDHDKDQRVVTPEDVYRRGVDECTRSSSHLVELDQVEGISVKLPGLRRMSSSSPEISRWNTMPPSNDHLSSSKPELPPWKMASLAGFLNAVESSFSKWKQPSGGFKKLRVSDLHQYADSALPKAQILTRVRSCSGSREGTSMCCERSNSCLDGCDDYYNKQLHGWQGAIQRLLQRSQYQIQYSRPVQAVFCIVLLCLLAFLALLTL